MATAKKVKKETKKTGAEKPTVKKKPTEVATHKKITVENPREKHGVNISQEKYDLIRQNILSYIWRNEEVLFSKLLEDLEKKLASHFESSASPHITGVIIDLEAKGILEEVPDKKPQHLRLKQRLEQPED